MRKRGSFIATYKIELMRKERKKWGGSVSVCGSNGYALVEILDYKTGYLSSRNMVFKVCGGKLVMEAILDNFSGKVGTQQALEFSGMFEGI